ncbi:MAG: hypothetical protein K6347_00535 [Campylobacterales bacterium]
MTHLLINALLPDIRSHLSHHYYRIIQAPPGVGKITAIPLALFHETLQKVMD